jgi:hypothetical protein
MSKILVVADELDIRKGCWRALPVMSCKQRCILTKGMFCAEIFRGRDAAMALSLEGNLSSVAVHRHLTHQVFARAMPLIQISRTEGLIGYLQRPFLIHANKESQ